MKLGHLFEEYEKRGKRREESLETERINVEETLGIIKEGRKERKRKEKRGRGRKER